jgi:hypothetical protein
LPTRQLVRAFDKKIVVPDQEFPMRKSIAFLTAAALVAFGSATFAADESSDSPQARQARMDAALRDARSGKPAESESLGTRVKQDASNAGHAIGNGARRAGHSIGDAASATGHAISNGAHRTGAAISNGAHRTGQAISNGAHRTGHAIHDATHPASSGS